MKGDRSDFFFNFESARHNQVNWDSAFKARGIISQPNGRSVIVPINKNDLHSRSHTAADTHTSETGVMLALGFIASLILFSGMQLYRCVNLNLASTATTQSERTFIINSKDVNNNLNQETNLNEANTTARQKIEMSAIQNSISLGGF